MLPFSRVLRTTVSLLACLSVPAVIGAQALTPAADVDPVAIVQSTAVAGAPCERAVLGTNCQGYFPDVVLDPKGDGVDDLLMVYRWSSAHSRKVSELRMIRSRDGGATWQRATPFIVGTSEVYDFRDPSLSAIRSGPWAGRLLLSYFLSRADNGAVVGTYVRHRDVDNDWFTLPTLVKSSTMPKPVTTSKIVSVSTTNQLLIPVYGTPSGGGPHHSAVIASIDGGATWDGTRTGRQKTVGASSTRYYQEPAITEIEPGHIRMIMRTATLSSTGGLVTGAGYQSDSYDATYMTTWTAPWSLGVMMHGQEVLRIPGTNRVPTLWSQPNTSTSPTNRVTYIKMRHTDVLWQDTPTYTIYNPGSNWDAGYPSSVPIGTTKLVTAVYDTDRRAVLILRYNVSDVDF